MRSPADAVPSWVWVPEVPPPGERITLGEDASHHVRRVCRARPGDTVAVTDGRGAVGRVRLADGAAAIVLDRHDEPPPAATVIACGAPEGERGDWLVEKLAELGVAAFQPVDTERARWRAAGAREERWRRLVRAAVQQSRGAWALEVRPVQGLAEFLSGLPAGGARWLADVAGPSAGAVDVGQGAAVGLVGPAAGLSERERDLAVARGFRPIALARRRLRAETAALALAAWWASGERPAGGETTGTAMP